MNENIILTFNTFHKCHYIPPQIRSIFQDWTIVYVFACFTMAFALTPTTFVALLSGYFLGWIAFFPLAISYWVASLIGFSIANKIDDGRLSAYIQQKPKVQALLQNLQTNEFKIIFLARLSPVLRQIQSAVARIERY